MNFNKPNSIEQELDERHVSIEHELDGIHVDVAFMLRNLMEKLNLQETKSPTRGNSTKTCS